MGNTWGWDDRDGSADFLDEIENLSIEATLPSGAVIFVGSGKDKETLEYHSERIMSQHKFSNPFDLKNVDQIVQNGALAEKYNAQIRALSSGSSDGSYSGDISSLQKRLVELTDSTLRIEKSLGIDRATRESGRGEDLSTWVGKLLDRAEAFGVKRNKEAVEAVEWVNEVISKAQLWNQTNDDERQVMRANAEEILMYILEVVEPAFTEIDKKFREEEQKYWIGDM